MRLVLLHRHHHSHDCQEPGSQRDDTKSRRILKKIAKVERKLAKYKLNESASLSACSRSSSRSRSPTKSRGKQAEWQAEWRSGFGDGSRGSDSDSDLSASGHSKLISECKSRRRRRSGRRASCTPARSRSLAESGDCCRGSLAGGHRRQRAVGRHSERCKYLGHHYENGIEGCAFRIVAQSEPDLQCSSRANELGGGGSGVAERSRVSAKETESASNGGEAAESPLDDSAQDSGIDRILSDDSLEILRQGLPAERKRALLRKYRAKGSCLLLRGPKLNAEVLSAATERGIRRDVLLMCQQNQIGAGLVALGQAISDLTNKSGLRKDQDVGDILDTLNDAAAIILDSQFNVTKRRQLLMLPELHKKVRSMVGDCRADEWLYGTDFGQKVKEAKIFRKGKKIRKIFRISLSDNPCDRAEACEPRNNDDDDDEPKKHLN